MDLLPVKYKSQKNPSMDNTLCEQWVREIDRRMKAAKQNILLIVDNCTAHVTVNGLNKARFKRHTIVVSNSINQLSSTFSATVARRLNPTSRQSQVARQAGSSYPTLARR